LTDWRLDHVDAGTFVRQVMRDDTPPSWAWLGKMATGGQPHVAYRVRDHYRAGFLDLRDPASATDEALAAEHGTTEGAIDERQHPPTSH
jgi:hypothetical protein